MPVGYRSCSTSFSSSAPLRRSLSAFRPTRRYFQSRGGAACPLCCSLKVFPVRKWGNSSRRVRVEAYRMVVSTMMTGVVEKEEVVLGDDDLVIGQAGEFNKTFWELGFAEDKAAQMDELAEMLTKAAVELKRSRGGGGGHRTGAQRGPRKYLRTNRTIIRKTIPVARRLEFLTQSVPDDTEDIMTSKEVGRKPFKDSLTPAQLKRLKLSTKKTVFTGPKLTDRRITPLLEATKSPLLTAEEEVKLGTVVQRAVRLERADARLEEELGRKPSLQERAKNINMSVRTYRKVVQAAKIARKTFVTRNMRLVVSVAKKYHMSDGDLADLVSDGLTGLNRAIEKFDPTLGFRFSTYAHWWIRQAAVRGQTDQSRVIRVPTHVYELLSKVKKCENMLSQQGKPVNDEIVSEILHTTARRIRKARNALKKNVQLDAPLHDANHHMHDVIEDPKGELGDTASLCHSLKFDLENVLDTLYPRERNVLRLRYGLDDGKERTLVEIGEFLSITRERVRQIEMKAVRKLRMPERCGNLLDYKGEASGPVRPPGRVPGYARKAI